MQTKRRSITEAILNTASGFIVAMLTWRFIISPLFNIVHDVKQNLAITIIFTVISIARSYVWRRIFNKGDSVCTTAERDKDSPLVVFEIQQSGKPGQILSARLQQCDSANG